MSKFVRTGFRCIPAVRDVDVFLLRLNGVRHAGRGRWIACCPSHDDRRPSLSIREVEDGRVLLHDFGGCSTDEVLAALGLDFEAVSPGRRSGGGNARMSPTQRADAARSVWNAKQARIVQQRAEHARHASNIAWLWSQALPVARGDPVAFYLANRGIDLWPLPACLRLHPGLPYYDSGKVIGKFVAMIAPLVTFDRRIVALHRTFLTDQGHKAPVPAPKKLTNASGALAGSAIPLGRPNAGVIGIAEGIETALAATCASDIPVVAAYCAANLAAWRWPVGTRRIVIFGDNDPVGREAAASLKLRAASAQVDAKIMIPKTSGLDWNDVLRASLGVAA